MTPLIRWLLAALSPAGPRAGLTTLIFHRVREGGDPLWSGGPDERQFDELLSTVETMFRVWPLDEAAEALNQGRLPARALSITFDDGYADNYTAALPILRRHRMTATFFVSTDFLDGGRMWNDTVVESIRLAPGPELDLSRLSLGTHRVGSIAERRATIRTLLGALKYVPMAERLRKVESLTASVEASLRTDLMLSTEQLRGLRAAGMQIGGHTCGHPILTSVTDEEARNEILQGKSRLEAILGEPLSLFAYPNGKPEQDYSAVHVKMVREAGYRTAVSTAPGMARQSTDPLQLPRFTPWDRAPWRFGLRMARNMQLPTQCVSV
jgi:peptidoglycan/xylan/chitin deacetylase (PgdA/CDA1 family)